MSLVIYATVAAGGALGAMLCHSVSLLTGAGFFGINGPLATLSVNVVGCGVMGLLAGLVAGGLILPEAWRAFFAVGLLGALTHFPASPWMLALLCINRGLVWRCSMSDCPYFYPLAALHCVTGLSGCRHERRDIRERDSAEHRAELVA